MQKLKKKTYQSPEVETMEMTATQIICGSSDENYGGSYPGLNDDNTPYGF